MMETPTKRKARLFVYEDVKVHFHEVDGYRVVHNARFHVYFDIGRFKMLGTFFARAGAMERSTYTFPVVRDSCRFVRFARMDDHLVIETRFDYTPPLRIAVLRFEHRVLLRTTGQELAHGTSDVGICDTNMRLLGTVPDRIREYLAEQIEYHTAHRSKETRVLLG